MTRLYRTALSIMLTVACALTAAAQNSLTVDVPSVVSTDEIFRVVFTASYSKGRVTDFTPPAFDGLEVLAGPVSSTSTSFQSINGKNTTSSSRSFTYTVRALKEGKITLAPASVRIGGEVCSSSPVTIEAIKGDAAGGSTSSPRAESAAVGEDLMLRLTVSKTDVVVGEPVIATLKLYVRTSSIGGFEDVRFPAFDGFWSQEIDAPQNIQFSRENYNGQVYNAALLRRYMLLPQQTGEITVDPAEIVCLLQVRTRPSASQSIFDGFFDTYQTLRKRVSSDPVTVRVSPLPSGAPASFTGGVGDYSMSASFSTDSVKAHEAASLKVVISGTGNINLLEAPSVQLPPDFESYDMRKTEDIKAGASGASGRVIFEFPFIPRAPGRFVIPPVEFTYYDIASGRYRTLSSGPLSLGVAEGDAASAAVMPSGVNKQSVKSLGEDIRFISTVPHLRMKGRLLADTPFMWIYPLVLVLLTAAVWVWLERTASRRSDLAGTRNRRARKVAGTRLRSAASYMKQGLFSAFYEELHKALEGYISDKLMLPVADLTRERIESELRASGKDEALVRELFEILDACEYARYAPAADSGAMDTHYRQAVKVISEIES